MSEPEQRWLDGLAGRGDQNDPAAREGAAVRDYFQRRSSEEAAMPPDPAYEARMLAHLRARGAFDPAPAGAGTSQRPGRWAGLRDWLSRPLQPRLALGFGGAVLTGLAAVLVLHSPDSGKPQARLAAQIAEPLPAVLAPAAPATSRVPATPPAPAGVPLAADARLAANAPLKAAPASPSLAVPGTPPATPSGAVQVTAPELATKARVERPAGLAAETPRPLPEAAPNAALSAASGRLAAAPAAKFGAPAEAAPLAPERALAAGLPERIALDRLFDAGAVTLNEDGRRWLEAWSARHDLPDRSRPRRVQLGLSAAQGSPASAIGDRDQRRAQAVFDWLRVQRPGLVVQWIPAAASSDADSLPETAAGAAQAATVAGAGSATPATGAALLLIVQ